MGAVRRFLFFPVLAALLALSCGPKEPVVARVGPLEITQGEFRRKLTEVAQGYQGYVLTPTGRRQFLDILIREKLVLAAAQASDVRDSAEFKERLDKLRKEEEARLREGRDYLLTRLWIEDLRRKGVLKATEDEARDYLRKHPKEAHIRHILLADPQEAERLAKRARRGANFAALAKARSLDATSAVEGGRMAPALYGEIIPDLEDVVFRMRVGEVTGPIKSKFGYHVLKKDRERRPPFREVKDRILRLLEKQKLDRHLQSLQETYPVEVLDEQFK